MLNLVRRPLLIFSTCVLLTGWLTAGNFALTDKLLQQVSEYYGEDAKQRLLEWQDVVQQNQHLSEQEKLELVNDFFNRVRFINDIDHWHQEDYWATPVEFLSTNGGDCEDFSIAKYFTLKELGIPMERMRITYVKALDYNQAHMVLTYYATPDAEPVVLDNLISEIKPASRRTDLVPVYSFNGNGLWLSKERGKGQRVGSSRRIRMWQDLGLRLNRQHGTFHGRFG